jgi:hypothetical protein
MSKIEVNAIEPQCGTNLTLGASGDTIIIPAGANATLGGSGSTITIPSGATISNQGTAAGFGPTGAVSWNTTKITADPNPAVSGVGYFADTTSAAFTITLPSSPAAGAVIGIADYANTFATNNITVARNGSNIGGVAVDATLSTDGISVTFVYVDATQGWIVTDSGQRSNLITAQYIVATGGTITCDGDFKVHTFTGPGTFCVTSGGNPAGSDTVDYLVVAGGASGGQGDGGGGGAGGYRESSGAASGCYSTSPLGACVSALPVTAQGYPITVGAGGATITTPGTNGPNGSNSVFSTITSTGGGGGSGATPSASSGGSGGGGKRDAASTGGAGNTPPVSPPQGNPGGTSVNPGSGWVGASGGGGATAAGIAGTGGSPSTERAGNGGAGGTTCISGSPTSYAGGGGGSAEGASPACFGVGGVGGGGAGRSPTIPREAQPATINTGGGGGGANGNCNATGAGGSGIVIIRYKFQ